VVADCLASRAGGGCIAACAGTSSLNVTSHALAERCCHYASYYLERSPGPWTSDPMVVFETISAVLGEESVRLNPRDWASRCAACGLHVPYVWAAAFTASTCQTRACVVYCSCTCRSGSAALRPSLYLRYAEALVWTRGSVRP